MDMCTTTAITTEFVTGVRLRGLGHGISQCEGDHHCKRNHEAISKECERKEGEGLLIAVQETRIVTS